MQMNPNIILAGQQPDLVAALDAGNTARARQDQFQHNNAFRSMMQEQGPGIMRGDQNALAEFARFDAPGALGIQQTRGAMQLTQAQLDQVRQTTAQAARTSQSAQQVQQELAQARRMMAMGAAALQSGNEQQWNMVAAEFGFEGLPMDPQSIAIMEAAVDGLDTGLAAIMTPQQPEQTTGTREYEMARSQGYQGTFMDYQREIAEAKRAQTTINNNLGDTLSPFQKKRDEAFASDALEWMQGGGSDMVSQTAQLATVLGRLEGGEALTGPEVAIQPDFLLAITNPNAVDAREKVEEVVQRNLRLILGAQFTENEGNRLIARAYNPRLSPQVNAGRVRRLILQMQAAAEQKQAMVDYANQNGTLAGYTGRMPSMADFVAAIEGTDDVPPPQGGRQPAPAPAQGGGTNPFRDAPLDALMGMDVNSMSRDQLMAYNARMQELLANE